MSFANLPRKQFIWNSRQLPIVGNWGPVSSTIDWCEANYIVSPYIAEFYNTISNLIFIYLAGYGIYQYNKENLGTRYCIAMFGILFVGLGSLAFHGTLRYEFQLLDELPMIYTSNIITYCLFATKPRSPLVAVGIGLMSTIITLVYLYYPNPVFHESMYALIAVINISRSFYLHKKLDGVYPISRKDLSRVQTIGLAGMGLFIAGFGVWNIDNFWCDTLHDLKLQLGFPLSVMLEGHAFWHIATGYGSFLMLTAVTYLTICIRENSNAFEIQRWGIFMYSIKRTSEKDAKFKSQQEQSQKKFK